MPSKNKVDKVTGLTTRQRNLLFAVVKEYCENGSTVSSKDLKEKYGFNISPATIRNEFIALRDLEYLFQPFTNSSSRPTEKAFKLFVNQLLTGLQVSSRQQMHIRQQILELQDQNTNLQREISRLLALNSGGVGFSLDKDSESVSGLKNLLLNSSSNPQSQVSDILDFLDNIDKHKQFLLESKQDIEKKASSRASGNRQWNSLQTIFGSDNPILPLGKGYALAATEVIIDGRKTVIGVVSSAHLIARRKNLELLNGIQKALTGNPISSEEAEQIVNSISSDET